jgi:YbbR domain-containing protein
MIMKFKKINFSFLKEAKTILASKALIGSVLLAAALWSYTSLSDTYISLVKLPLIINLPEDRAIEKNPPEKIAIEVRGSGWEIFNLVFFNSAAKVEIDLMKEDIRDSVYRITRNDIIKNVFHLTNLQAIDVVPGQIVLYTGGKISKKVPVKSNLMINPKDGFMLIGEQEINPPMINISGNKKVVDQIDEWQTSYTEINKVFQDFRINVPLLDTLQNIIQLSQSSVVISGNIQQAGELTFYDIPIIINGGSLPDNHRIYPQLLRIVVRSGINELEKLVPEDIEASIDFSDIINDKTGYIKPNILTPEKIEVISVIPEFINHKKIYNSTKNIKEEEIFY